MEDGKAELFRIVVMPRTVSVLQEEYGKLDSGIWGMAVIGAVFPVTTGEDDLETGRGQFGSKSCAECGIPDPQLVLEVRCHGSGMQLIW